MVSSSASRFLWSFVSFDGDVISRGQVLFSEFCLGVVIGLVSLSTVLRFQPGYGAQDHCSHQKDATGLRKKLPSCVVGGFHVLSPILRCSTKAQAATRPRFKEFVANSEHKPE